MEEMEPKDKAEEITEHHRERFTRTVAVIVALVAAFMTIVRLTDEKVVESILAAQAQELDQWNYYQAQSIKQHGYVLQIEQWKLLPGILGAAGAKHPEVERQLRVWQGEVTRYDGKKAEAMEAAKRAQELYERLERKNDRLHLAEGLLSLSIALFAVSMLTRNRPLFALAMLFAVAGSAVGLLAFVGAGAGAASAAAPGVT